MFGGVGQFALSIAACDVSSDSLGGKVVATRNARVRLFGSFDWTTSLPLSSGLALSLIWKA